jgi:hypothetical protein
MPLKQVSDGGPDGTVVGQSSTDKIAFYGATPVVKQAATVLGALTTGETTAADIALALCDLRDQLVDLGLISNT